MTACVFRRRAVCRYKKKAAPKANNKGSNRLNGIAQRGGSITAVELNSNATNAHHTAALTREARADEMISSFQRIAVPTVTYFLRVKLAEEYHRTAPLPHGPRRFVNSLSRSTIHALWQINLQYSSLINQECLRVAR